MTILSRKYNPENGEMLYQLQPPIKKGQKAENVAVFSFAVGIGGKQDKVLSLWKGTEEQKEAQPPIVVTDPIKFDKEKAREDFVETVLLEFGFEHDTLPPELTDTRWLMADLKAISTRLQEHIDDALRALGGEEGGEYLELKVDDTPIWRTKDGYFFHSVGRGRRQLWNASAHIAVDKVVDDGSGETKRYFILEVHQGETTKRITVPSSEFDDLNWIRKHLPLLTHLPRRANRPWVVRAIQEETRHFGSYELRVFAHTGWREIEKDQWAYLHSQGALIAPGSPRFVGQVELDKKFARRRFPTFPEEETRKAIKASFDLWDLPLPDEITVPLMASIYRTAIGEVDFMVHLAGKTNAGKTTLARLVTQFFGADLGLKDQEGYRSTSNKIEELGFLLKDQPLVVDDFQGGPVHRRTFEDIARALANRTGRGRMHQADRPPRGLYLSTGEELPQGESVTTRVLVLRFPEGAKLDFYAPDAKIDKTQAAARSGTYAAAMRAFIEWLAPRYDGIHHSFEEDRRRYGFAVTQQVSHARTAEIYGSLMHALTLWLDFAVEWKAITPDEREGYAQRAELSLLSAIHDQDLHVAAATPAERFRQLITSALEVGTVHLRAPSEEVDPAKHRGIHLGWVDEAEGSLYLRSARSVEIARQQAPKDDPFTVSTQVIYESLAARGYLRESGKGRKGRDVTTVRREFEGKQTTVLHLKPEFLEEVES